MPITVSEKKISNNGSSKVIAVTKDLQTLGVKNQDNLLVALAEVSEDNKRAMESIQYLGSPDYKPLNTKYIGPESDIFPQTELDFSQNKDNDEAFRILCNEGAFNVVASSLSRVLQNNISDSTLASYHPEISSAVRRFTKDSVNEPDPFIARMSREYAIIKIIRDISLPLIRSFQTDVAYEIIASIREVINVYLDVMGSEPEIARSVLEQHTRRFEERRELLESYKDSYVGMVLHTSVEGDKEVELIPPFYLETTAASEDLAKKSLMRDASKVFGEKREKLPEPTGVIVVGPMTSDQAFYFSQYIEIAAKLSHMEDGSPKAINWFKEQYEMYMEAYDEDPKKTRRK